MYNIRLRELRLSKNLTLKALAEDLGLKESALSKYERSEREPNIDMLITFANYFDVSVDYLIGKTDFKSNDSQAISKELGLSEQSIEVLKKLSASKSFPTINNLDLLEAVIQHQEFTTLIDKIIEYLLFDLADEISIKTTNPKTHKVEIKTITANILKSSSMQDIANIFQSIVEGIPHSEHYLNKQKK